MTETEGIARIPIQRGPGTYGIIGVQYQVLPGTATASLDYLVEADVVTLPSGTAKATVDITIVDDTVQEFEEVFSVMLIAAIGKCAFLGKQISGFLIFNRAGEQSMDKNTDISHLISFNRWRPARPANHGYGHYCQV